MPRPPRLQSNNAIDHIVTRGDGRRRLFHDEGHYKRFTEGLIAQVDRCTRDATKRSRWRPKATTGISVATSTSIPAMASSHWLSHQSGTCTAAIQATPEGRGEWIGSITTSITDTGRPPTGSPQRITVVSAVPQRAGGRSSLPSSSLSDGEFGGALKNLRACAPRQFG